MENMYGFWNFGDSNRLTQSEIQEDQSWKVVATKLAFADQMRFKFDRSRPDVKVIVPHEKNNKQTKGKSKARADESLKGDGYNQKYTESDQRYGDLGQKLGLSNTLSATTVNSTDKRFKSLPASETLPRHETLGGYIFVCNNDTMAEDLKRQLFGLPQRYRDSVRAIQPGLPLFLYNYTTHQLHGVYEAASFGGSNIDPTAWEDKKCKGESRFPAQVRIRVRKLAKPLEEDSFRPVLYHYDGPKFRLQLSVPETLALLDLFSEAGMA
ncbi:hypothetical protein KP509_07G012900 [Ceratopteris richardii]|uniref:DCD domain-containing protein n=1 Tax=Ceratopteris richardii TaxID=49495 RepID=A0A8T2U8M9_CERRI|nr:hypothetical protein KP509_07G012900 [Ceratopteris richardii]KAH7432197.1 hypothetical protein KP509_07G012900 [Ceratopteris richardii]